jgi:membrane-associated protease RseP (regulator of RpoE activity)
MEPLELLFVLFAIWICVYVLLQRLSLKKENIEVNPLYIMFRTTKLNNYLRKTAQSNPRFWQIFSNIGIVVGCIEIVLAIYFLILNLYRFLYIPQEAAAMVPLLPGITVSLGWFPYILIAIAPAITIHELSHGVIAFLEKIPVKSSGIVIAPITFGGFVEPDDTVFEKASLVSKLRIISVGSLSNIIVGLLAILITFTLFIPASGVLIMNVQAEGPAFNAGMRPWDVIFKVNGSSTSNLGDFIFFMSKVGPGTLLVIETSNGIRNVVTKSSVENASRGIIGVRDLTDYYAMRIGEIHTQLSYQIYTIFNWISIIMVNLAIFNMIPLFPLDGENFIYSILKVKMTKRIKETRLIINAIFLTLIVLNFLFSFVTHGITPI